ncbi:MAG: hypothetical protein KDA86_02950 [Planctomycetaceae bacterium]|nr:hypothetical protein [Planctomycetaceae bacterium]
MKLIHCSWAIVCLALMSQAAFPDDAIVMQAGTAKAVITPKDAEPLTLVMGVKSSGVTHDIYARALVLNDGRQRLVILTYDLNCLDVATPILRERCKDELDIDASRLIILSTHNHAAPIQIVPDNFEYGRWLADRSFELIKQAMAAEHGPATVKIGSGNGYFVQSVGHAPVDSEIQVMRIDVDEQPIALLFNHPTHPLQFSRTEIDTGHPGYAIDEIEQAMPGVLAMYADACGGNQFPDRGVIMYGTKEQMHELGHELADAVLTITRGPLEDVTGPISSKLEVIPLPLAEPLSYEETKKLVQDQKVPTEIGLVPYPHPDRGTNWIRQLLKHHEENIPFPKLTTDRVCTDDGFLVREYDVPREFPCEYEEVIVTRIGPMALVAMQGEVCAPIGMRIKDQLRRFGLPMMVFAYMGEHNLYIPTRELVRVDAYQAQVIRIQYASPVGWAPEVEDEMVRGVIRVVRSMFEDVPATKEKTIEERYEDTR